MGPARRVGCSSGAKKLPEERPFSAVADPIQSIEQYSLGPSKPAVMDQSATEGGSRTGRYVAATRDEGNAADDA
ncbi:MAG: hypothetical protein C4576_09275 [Desulfobacteraceae bacterium]|nr:MAG: hypothetical protein C4576_09275 [Desulfobacteraceae bacterium]